MSDHLVVALFGAVAAILGLMLALSLALDRCAQLREERDAADALLRSLGVRRRPPSGGKAE